MTTDKSSDSSSDNKSVQEQANLWITRLDKGLSRTEKQHLVAWINQDKAHYAAFKKLSFLWTDISTKHELSGLFIQTSEKEPHFGYLIKTFLALSLITAVLLTVNLFTDISLLWPSQQRDNAKQWVYQKYSSQYGEQKKLTLNDGSIVELNTNSVIEVAYTEQQRKITLIRGEARFDVAKDKKRPFTVISGHNSFTALGTVFNVQRENVSSVELLVKEGRVLVAEANVPVAKLLSAISVSRQQSIVPLALPLASSVSEEAIQDKSILTAGEKIAIADNISSDKQWLSAQEVKQELAWQQGMLIFDGEPLAQVLKEVQRYNQIKFTPIDNELAKLRISGYFKTNDINGLLQSISYNFDIKAQELTSNTYTLSRTL